MRSEQNILDKEKDNVQNESCLKNIIDTDKNQCATAESLYVEVDTVCNERDLTGMKMWILENESGNNGKNLFMIIN